MAFQLKARLPAALAPIPSSPLFFLQYLSKNLAMSGFPFAHFVPDFSSSVPFDHFALN